MEGSDSLPYVLRAVLYSMTTSTQKFWEPSSTLTFLKLKCGKKAAPQARRATPLLNLQTLKRRRNRVPPLAEAKVPIVPISISSSENEHSNDLAFAPLQLAGEVEITHSFKERYDKDMSSGKINMGKFRTLG